MRNPLLPFCLALLACGFSQPAFAKKPENGIITQGETMFIKSDKRVEGRITDLEMHKKAHNKVDDRSCYFGEPKQVCEILKVAAKEESEKTDAKVELDSCEMVPGPGPHDRIAAKVSFNGENSFTNLIPVCDSLGISDDPWDVGI